MKEYTVLHNHNVASSVAGFSLHDSQQGTYFSVCFIFYWMLVYSTYVFSELFRCI